MSVVTRWLVYICIVTGGPFNVNLCSVPLTYHCATDDDDDDDGASAPLYVSVNPVHRDPLWLCGQLLHSFLQFLKGLVQIVINYSQIKVVIVCPLDPGTFVHCFL